MAWERGCFARPSLAYLDERALNEARAVHWPHLDLQTAFRQVKIDRAEHQPV